MSVEAIVAALKEAGLAPAVVNSKAPGFVAYEAGGGARHVGWVSDAVSEQRAKCAAMRSILERVGFIVESHGDFSLLVKGAV